MASSGKKGKKSKGKTVALTEFLLETPGETPTIPIRKSVKSNLNWADDVEDVTDSYDSRPKTNVVLPTAPKASRGYDDFSEKIPQNPPFLAYLSNLPYDINENEIADFFANLRIASMRMPKEGEGQKLRGFGYVEFEDRDSLIGALSITDCTLKSRRIRIELATNSENEKRRGGRSDNNRDRQERPEVSSGDWRSGPRAEPVESERSERSRVSFNRDRDDKGDKGSSGSWRDNSDRPSFRDTDNRSFSRDSDNRSFSRDSDNRSFSRDSDNRSFNRDSDRRFGSDREGDKRGLNRRNDREEFTRGNREDPSSETRTRTRLIMAPRSIPENQETTETPQPVATPVLSASIFGNAKPVDTSLREREIESRLAKQLEKPADSSREIRRDAWGKRNEEDGRSRRSPQRRSSLDHSPNRFDKDRRSSLERKGSPIRRNRSPAYRRNSPGRRSPDNRRCSPESKWRSPNRRRSPDRRYSPNRKYSPDKKYSSDRSSSPDFNRHSPPRRSYSPESNQSPDRKTSPIRRSSSDGRKSPEHRHVSPERRLSPVHRRTSPERSRASPERRRTSPELRRRTPEPKKSPEHKKHSSDRSRISNQRKNSDEKDNKRGSTKSDRPSQKNDKDKHRKEDKSSRDNHDRDMPKMKEPEPPNFAASNKYAFLDADDSE